MLLRPISNYPHPHKETMNYRSARWSSRSLRRALGMRLDRCLGMTRGSASWCVFLSLLSCPSPRDIRRGGAYRQLKAIEKTLEDLRVSVAPKAKFAFQRKTKPSTATPLPPPPEPAKSTQISDMHTNLNLNPSLGGGGVGSSTPTTNVTLVGQSNRYLTLRSLPAFRSDGERGGHSDLTLSDLDGCIVNLLSPSSGQMSTGTGTGISAVHVRNVTNTVLFLPADIRGSVILHGLVRCIVVVGCHQFRMHNSRDVDVYLSIPSNPIIEHSSGIRFAAYPALLLSSGSSSHVKDSKHTSVQDFSHIRPTQSPNWSVMHDEDRPVQDWFEPLLNMNEGGEEKEVGSVLLDGVLPRSDTAR